MSPTGDPEGPFVVGFVGYADDEHAEQAAEYEATVLPFLADHGARLLFRGRRAPGEDDSLPAEINAVWFPHQRALDEYLADERRAAAIAAFGDVFHTRHIVNLAAVEAEALDGRGNDAPDPGPRP